MNYLISGKRSSPHEKYILKESKHMFYRLWSQGLIYAVNLKEFWYRHNSYFVIMEKQEILFQISGSSDITQHLCLPLTQNKQMNDIYHWQVIYFLVLSHLIHNDYLSTNIRHLLTIWILCMYFYYFNIISAF